MPSYTYMCENKNCPNHYEFTVIQYINESPLDRCSKCGSEVKRVFKPIGVNLNFDGSYNNTRGK